MRVIAVANQKGGTGKTTTAVSLGAALGETGRRVLLVDLDPQASASTWLGVEDDGEGLCQVFKGSGRLDALVRETGAPGLSLVPGSGWLLVTERDLAQAEQAETRLVGALETLEPGTWDYVLLDCAPTLGLLTLNALAAAREVLIPLEAHVLPMNGLVELLKTLEVIRQRVNPRLGVAGILVCRLDARTRHGCEVVELLRRRFGDLVFDTVIRQNVRLAECPSFGRPVTLYAPKSAGACDYRHLAAELVAQEAVGYGPRLATWALDPRRKEP